MVKQILRCRRTVPLISMHRRSKEAGDWAEKEVPPAKRFRSGSLRRIWVWEGRALGKRGGVVLDFGIRGKSHQRLPPAHAGSYDSAGLNLRLVFACVVLNFRSDHLFFFEVTRLWLVTCSLLESA